MFAAYARPRFVLLLRNENVKSRHYVQRHHETRKPTKVVCVGEPFHPLPLFGLNWDLKSEEGIFSLSLFFLRLLLAHNHRSTRLLFFIQQFLRCGKWKTLTHTSSRRVRLVPTHSTEAAFRRLPQHFPVACAIPKKRRLSLCWWIHYFSSDFAAK